MNKEKALNIARGCVIASRLSREVKKEVLDVLNELEEEEE